MKTISLTAFLSEIDQNVQDNKPVFFSIKFVKKGKNEQDKERGKLRHVEFASKGWKDSKLPNASNGDGKKFYNVKESGVLVLYDHERKEYFTPSIDLIISYNNQRIVR